MSEIYNKKKRYNNSRPNSGKKPRHDDHSITRSERTRESQQRHIIQHGRPEGVFTTLLPQLQRAIAESGYSTPSPIQAQAIPHLIEGRDLLGCAQTGTGKTAAFMLPILHYLAQSKQKNISGKSRVLVLAPTRELAGQIGDSITAYGCHLQITHTVIFGGVSQGQQVKKLRQGLDVVVATPGRLLDLVQQRHLYLDRIEVFVLDEADRMLDMGFIPDIRKVISKLPARRQSLFFSATMSPEVIALANTLIRDAVHITITPDQPAVERIEQKVFFVGKQSKNTLLTSLLNDSRLDKVIVFTRMKHGANKVVEKLKASGVTAVAIHGNKSQSARTEALTSFKSGNTRILVATDIAARGIDVDRISHVINYDLPNDPETYIHRIGRTARAGSDGIAFSFCSAEERDYLRDIEKLLGKPVPTNTNHDYHCETARTATGADARPAPKKQQGNRATKSPKKPYNAYRSGNVSRFGKQKIRKSSAKQKYGALST